MSETKTSAPSDSRPDSRPDSAPEARPAPRRIWEYRLSIGFLTLLLFVFCAVAAYKLLGGPTWYELTGFTPESTGPTGSLPPNSSLEADSKQVARRPGHSQLGHELFAPHAQASTAPAQPLPASNSAEERPRTSAPWPGSNAQPHWPEQNPDFARAQPGQPEIAPASTQQFSGPPKTAPENAGGQNPFGNPQAMNSVPEDQGSLPPSAPLPGSTAAGNPFGRPVENPLPAEPRETEPRAVPVAGPGPLREAHEYLPASMPEGYFGALSLEPGHLGPEATAISAPAVVAENASVENAVAANPFAAGPTNFPTPNQEPQDPALPAAFPANPPAMTGPVPGANAESVPLPAQSPAPPADAGNWQPFAQNDANSPPGRPHDHPQPLAEGTLLFAEALLTPGQNPAAEPPDARPVEAAPAGPTIAAQPPRNEAAEPRPVPREEIREPMLAEDPRAPAPALPLATFPPQNTEPEIAGASFPKSNPSAPAPFPTEVEARPLPPRSETPAWPTAGPSASPAPAAAGIPTAGSSRRIYIVRAGETWFDIARVTLGRASRWVELVELNRDVYSEELEAPPPGTRLRIPDAGQPAQAVGAWRQ